MADTATNRKYAWGLQTDFQTQRALVAGALKQLIVTDENTIDYTPETANNEAWSHGFNSPTEQWLLSHDAKVQHTIPGFAQELGKIFYLNMADTVSTPSGGTLSRLHTFVPTDPLVTRQDKAVTYVERIASGWHKLMPSAVGDGFSLKGSDRGVLTCDFSLYGDGRIINNPAVTYPPTATPTVTNLTNLYKFFNTHMNITPDDGGSYNTEYGCRYRSFQIDFKKTLLSEAGFQQGCKRFLVPGDPDSGMIRSVHEFDKQTVEFNFQVDMAAGTPEFEAVQDQRPINLIIEAIGGIIEGAIPFQMAISMNIAYYKTTKPTLANGIWQFGVSGESFFDAAANNLLKIELVNDVVSYATAF